MRVRLHFSICCPVLFAAVTFFAAASSQAAEPLAFRRAIDLAFARFGDFGPDKELVALLAAAIECSGAPPSVLSRFAELAALCSC